MVDQWEDFLHAAALAGMDGWAPSDWDKARGIRWRYMDPDQRRDAIEGLEARIGIDCPEVRATPINYLTNELWKREVKNFGKPRRVATQTAKSAYHCAVCEQTGAPCDEYRKELRG